IRAGPRNIRLFLTLRGRRAVPSARIGMTLAFPCSWGRILVRGLSLVEMAMDQFDRCAFAITARDTSFVALAAVTLMIGFSFDPPLALKIGGYIAFLFCLGLLYRLY